MHTSIEVQITRIISDEFPGYVECSFTDVKGENHVFVEKLPIVSDCPGAIGSLPIPSIGHLRCTLVSSSKQTCSISTEVPDAIESLTGLSNFEVDPKVLGSIQS